MSRKSQITVYVILGLLIIIGSIFVFSNNRKVEFNNNYKSTVMFDSISYNIKDCVKEVTETGVNVIGFLSPDELQEYIIDNLDDCVNLDYFKEQGYKISQEDISVEIDVNEEIVDINVNYPMTVEKESNVKSFDSFSYTFPRSVNQALKFDSEGRTEKEYIISTPDNKYYLKIQKGVEIKDKQGNIPTEISFKLLDKHYDNQYNSFVIGKTILEAKPHGLQFSEAVDMIIRVNEQELPEGWTLEDAKEKLSIIYYDPKVDIWIKQPTEVDSTLSLKTPITHFSYYAPGYIEPNLDIEGIPSKTHDAIAYSYTPEFSRMWNSELGKDSVMVISFEDETEYQGEENNPVFTDPKEMCNNEHWEFYNTKLRYKGSYEEGIIEVNQLFDYYGFDSVEEYVDPSEPEVVSEQLASTFDASYSYINYKGVALDIVAKYFSWGQRMVEIGLNTKGATAALSDAYIKIAFLGDNDYTLFSEEPLEKYCQAVIPGEPFNIKTCSIPISDFDTLGFSAEQSSFLVNGVIPVEETYYETTMCPKLANVLIWFEGVMYPSCNEDTPDSIKCVCQDEKISIGGKDCINYPSCVENGETPCACENGGISSGIDDECIIYPSCNNKLEPGILCVCENGGTSLRGEACKKCEVGQPILKDGVIVCVTPDCYENEEEYCENNVYYAPCEERQEDNNLPVLSREVEDCSKEKKICMSGCEQCSYSVSCPQDYGENVFCLNNMCYGETNLNCEDGEIARKITVNDQTRAVCASPECAEKDYGCRDDNYYECIITTFTKNNGKSRDLYYLGVVEENCVALIEETNECWKCSEIDQGCIRC